MSILGLVMSLTREECHGAPTGCLLWSLKTISLKANFFLCFEL